MLKPYTETQKKRIAKNLVLACIDINELNNTAYKFISCANGFIAHYNLDGFKAHYSDGSLQDAIERNARFNQWSNFREGETNYEYYMSKKDIYNRVLGYFAAQEFLKQHFIVVKV